MFETIPRSFLYCLLNRARVCCSPGEYHNNPRNRKALGQSAAATARETTGHTRSLVDKAK